MRDTYPATSLETAACLWEAVFERRNHHPQINAAFERMGTSGLRLTVLRWTDAVDAAWEKVRDTYDQPFDWEFVPDWIDENIDWSDETPTYKTGGRP